MTMQNIVTCFMNKACYLFTITLWNLKTEEKKSGERGWKTWWNHNTVLGAPYDSLGSRSAAEQLLGSRQRSLVDQRLVTALSLFLVVFVVPPLSSEHADELIDIFFFMITSIHIFIFIIFSIYHSFQLLLLPPPISPPPSCCSPSPSPPPTCSSSSSFSSTSPNSALSIYLSSSFFFDLDFW